MRSPSLSIEAVLKKKVVVAMSGGVDSSVAALLLKEEGYEVIGVTLHLWAEQNLNGQSEVVAAAEEMASRLDIPFHAYDLMSRFRQKVVDPFCHDYLAGRTPNPCILCNQFLKFGELQVITQELGADYLATGHYAARTLIDGHYQVRKGRDAIKDQSYFLFTLQHNQLRHCLFPLGDLTKQQVRDYASRLDLELSEKKESQDICFIPDGDYAAFLSREKDTDHLAGEIVHVSGKVLAKHQGTFHYTVGQRKGLGIGWSEPLYVIALDAANQRVIVGERDCLQGRELSLNRCCLNMGRPEPVFSCSCRIRYRHREAPARVELLDNGKARVVFEQPQEGITPGQAAVFYEDDRVIGGGWIQ